MKTGVIFLAFDILSQNKGQARQSFLKRFKITTDKISFQNTFYYIFVYLISLSPMPFGISLFAAEYSYRLPLFSAVLILLGGFTPPFSAFTLLKSASAMLIFAAATAKFGFKKTPFLKAIIMSACATFCDLIPKLFQTLVPYDAIMIFVRSGMVFLCSYFFEQAKNRIFSPKEEIEPGSVFSLALFFGAAVYGMGKISVAGINIALSPTALMLLLFISANSPSLGAAAGIICGTALGLSIGSFPYYITLFAIPSVLSAFFVQFGKGSSALAFILGTSFATLYSQSAASGFMTLAQISTAALVFIFLPEKLSSLFSLHQKQNTPYSSILKRYISKTLAEKAEVIENISKTVSELCEGDTHDYAAQSYFERCTRRLCSHCREKQQCWRSEFHRTYSAFFVLVEICNKNGSISFCDIPGELTKKCVNCGLIVSTFNSMYDIYRVERLWECRIKENRSLVCSELLFIAEGVKSDAENLLSDISFIPDAKSLVIRVLTKDGIECEDIFVCKQKRSEPCVKLSLSSSQTKTDEAEASVSRALNDNYKCIFRLGSIMHLSPFPQKHFISAIAAKAKGAGSKSGDTASYCHLPHGRYMMFLSDGMGIGERAGRDSRTAAEIAQKMLQSGFTPTSAMETINCALLLKSHESSFSGVDMAIINPNSGEADFYKMGAAPAFIKSGDTVKTIYSTTLPAGSFSKSDIAHVNCPISYGDIIIMVSDGIANGENTSDIENIIRECSCTDAESFAKEILSAVLALGGENSDDITALVTFV